MPIPRESLRLKPDELNDLLTNERTARVATCSADGWPHVIPMWFVWRDGAMWVNSLIRSRRTKDIEAGSPASVCVDAGVDYGELRGAVLYGRFSTADDHADVDAVKAEFGAKYWNGIAIPSLRSHTWLRLEPERVISWDFSKIPSGRDKRLEALGSDQAGFHD